MDLFSLKNFVTTKINQILGLVSMIIQNRQNRRTEVFRTGTKRATFSETGKNRNRIFGKIQNRNRRILESTKHY